MTEAKAMAYVNMYGILGTLENLCAMNRRAKVVLSELKKPVSLCLRVKDGPCRTFHFSRDGCRITAGDIGCTCKMSFASPEKFNEFISSSKPGIPVMNPAQTLSFLLGPFTRLTNILTEMLRPSERALADPAFFEESTILTLYAISGAISALANNDSISRVSASYTVDGEISLGIRDVVYVTILVEGSRFTTVKRRSENPRAVMEFESLELASDLFRGRVSTINEMCRGTIYMRGMISMLDNVNRILDRVSVYLG